MAEQKLSDNATKAYKSDRKYEEDNRKRFRKIRGERKVPVYGNPLYKPFLGDVYSFDYQDFPVTIKFDGKQYMYPETIAKLLTEKLDAAAMSNVPKEVGAGDKL